MPAMARITPENWIFCILSPVITAERMMVTAGYRELMTATWLSIPFEVATAKQNAAMVSMVPIRRRGGTIQFVFQPL